MKVFATRFEHDGNIYDGPFIYARTLEEAEMEAIVHGVRIVGQVEIVIKAEEDIGEDRVLH
tara:strand:+ start:175 stop:357 length:183 start_codon:yes stop_codon:yes gene_type:complete